MLLETNLSYFVGGKTRFDELFFSPVFFSMDYVQIYDVSAKQLQQRFTAFF